MIAGFANKAVVNICFGTVQYSPVLVHHALRTKNGTQVFALRKGKNYHALKEMLALLVVLVGIISYRITELLMSWWRSVLCLLGYRFLSFSTGMAIIDPRNICFPPYSSELVLRC